MSLLDDQLQDAHASGDKTALVTLYSQAAFDATDIDARAFFLTHAYVFALEIAHPKTDTLRAELAEMGRETP